MKIPTSSFRNTTVLYLTSSILCSQAPATHGISQLWGKSPSATNGSITYCCNQSI